MLIHRPGQRLTARDSVSQTELQRLTARDSVSQSELRCLTARDNVSQKELRRLTKGTANCSVSPPGTASHKRNCELQRLTKGELQRLTKGTANCSVSQKELRTAASHKRNCELQRLTARDSVSPTELQRLTVPSLTCSSCSYEHTQSTCNQQVIRESSGARRGARRTLSRALSSQGGGVISK